MSGKVYNRFKILLAEKEIKENRRIPYDEIKEKTGIAASSISAWATNNITRFDADTIAEWCQFFDCGVGDLIVYQGNSNED
jgi:putative transcriptional regulator